MVRSIANQNTTKILGIILVVLVIAFIITIIVMNININPEKQEKQQANNELSTDQMLMLLKCAQYHLNKSENLENNSITDEYMIVFATDYLSLLSEYNVIYNNDYQTVKLSDIEQMVKFIFDRDINYSNVSFKVDGDHIYIPIYPIGTDAEIYKFRKRGYNESQNTYTVYIDCLEVGPSQYSELIEGSVTEYNQDDVIKTMIFKYKENEGRRVLLAYNSIFNI